MLRVRVRVLLAFLLSSSGVSYALCARARVGVSLEFFWRFECFVCVCWRFSRVLLAFRMLRVRVRVCVLAFLLSSSGVSNALCVCVGVSLEFFWRFVCFVCACACVCWRFS